MNQDFCLTMQVQLYIPQVSVFHPIDHLSKSVGPSYLQDNQQRHQAQKRKLQASLQKKPLYPIAETGRAIAALRRLKLKDEVLVSLIINVEEGSFLLSFDFDFVLQNEF